MVLWVKSYTSIGNHPKTRKLARRLDISTPEAVGLLHLLWHWALEYSEDGDLSKHDAEDLAVGAHFDGEPAAFLEALTSTGFVDQDDDGMWLHDWWDYAGRLIGTRRASADAGAFGNHKRWHEDRGIVDPACSLCAGESGGDRGAIGDPIGSRSQSRGEQRRAEQRARGGDEDLKAWLSSRTTKDGDPLHPRAVEHALRRIAQKSYSRPKAAALKIARDEHSRFVAEQADEDRRRTDAQWTAACKRCNGEGQVWLDEDETTRARCPECRPGAAS